MNVMFHGQNRNRNTSGYGYGRLYNWFAVDTGILAPTGWHVPTDAEWTTLTDYLGGESIAGGKLKETGTTHWSSPNTGATNESGFTALPGGYRELAGSFLYVGIYGFWWSATKLDDKVVAWYRKMYYNHNSVFRTSYNKQFGHAVRCIKDDSNNPGTVTDASGNVYNTITIGTQVWMQSNLKTLKYNNGTDIPFEGANSGYFTDFEWSTLTTPGVCTYNNDESYV